MKRFIALIAGFALACSCAFALTGCSQQDELRLGTGNEGGMYYRFGNLLAEASKDDPNLPTITVETTAGSSANLRLLSQDFLDLATVQADTLYDASTGTGLFANSGSYEGFSAVAGLYTEACQIIVPADSDIQSVDDLAGKIVSLGERESGVLQNAIQILDAYNLRESDMKAVYLSFSESAAALEDGQIDAAFITAAIPTPAVEALANGIGVRVIGLDSTAIDTLTSHHDYYLRCTIPADTYNGQTDAVETVGVRAVLVARNGVSDATVKALLELLFDGSIPFADQLGEQVQPVLKDATQGIPIAFHAGAAQFYADNGITVETASGATGSSVSASQDD